MKYEIYQMKPEHVGLRFMNSKWFKLKGEKITADKYTKVYEGDLDDNAFIYVEKKSCLEWIYQVFNLSRPEGFTGHSMSVSDVVVLDGKAYFCDSIGFTPLQDFYAVQEEA